MKLTNCGLLLIVSGAFCISLGNFCLKCPPPSQETSQCSDNGGMDMLILGRDGFMGYMTGACSNGTWRKLQCQSTIPCNSTGGSVKPQLLNMTVFSFENNTCTNNPCTTYSNDNGVSLSRSPPYTLNISRSVIPTFVCLIEAKCSKMINWFSPGQDCMWTNTSTKYDQTCNITCVNPTKRCKDAKYDNSCSGDESKINNIKFQNETSFCYKCGNPFQVMETVVLPNEMSNKFNTTKTETDAGAAAEVMKSLASIVATMKNLTVASISMGNVKGILKKISPESKIKTSYLIYSSATGIRVLEDADVLKNYSNAFSIPEEAAMKALNQSAENAFISVFRFPNMTKDAENSTVLNDEVYAIEMGANITNLSDPISLTFKISQTVIGSPVCKSWDGNGSQPNWTTEGCITIKGQNDITCKCEHLTFFALLMIPPNVTISSEDLNALTYITYIGCGLSLFFLSIGLFMHFLIRKVKATDSAHVLINLFVALFLLNVAFLSNEYVARAKDTTACKVMAGFMHYCLLSSFTWFGVEAFHLCLQMAKHSVTIKHYILKISVVGWAPPALVVSVIYALHRYGEQTITTGTSNVTMCWILDSDVHYYVNIGYYSFIFIFTFSTFIVVLRWLSMLKMSRLNTVTVVKHSRTATSDITSVLGLCCMLGLTWSFAFFGYGALRLPSYYIFTILNSLQGLFLFIYYLKTSTLIGDPAASEESTMTEVTNTENPYEDLPTEDTKKAT
ncbi:adhesion G-protein coupled receptor G5 [Puntigrus tetrazona]|uniref:adhesion G-protein coupled receptor G5 n=1 Tax=Puntigrus tetrazona TaxID=1606681 RepID=UPI001C89BA6E|nr:adhesion G-protein coupled receptor G5 [Puntigrus tetrazona]